MALRDIEDEPEVRFFEERGISPEVWRARGYRRWTKDNVEPIRQAFSGASARSMADILRKASEQPGWIIPRYLPPRMALPRIFPEYRPDKPVRTKAPSKHFHGDPGIPIPPPKWQCPNHKEKFCANCVSPRSVYTRDEMGEHIRKRHRGKNSNKAHYHRHKGKYQHMPNEMVDEERPHDHSEYAVYRKLGALGKHIQYVHDGVDVEGSHPHTRRAKDHQNGNATRIDVHPIAAKLLPASEVVFFVIEGCIKADAVLTYILKHGLRASVFSVPAIGQWDAPELPDFAALHLRGKTAYIVADADAYKNGLVMEQARLCQTWLRRLGITDTHVALPPAKTRRKYKGVDDFLAADRGRLEDLDIIDRSPSPALEEFVRRHQRRGDQGRRLADVLDALSMHAGPQGKNRASLRSQARVVRTNVERFRRGLDDLVELGAVTSDDLTTRIDAYVNKYYGLDLDEEWENRPTITIIALELRAIDQPKRKLGAIPKV